MASAKEIMEQNIHILEKHKDNPEEYLRELRAILHKPKHKSHGPKVQLYLANDLTKVVKLYDGITEASRKEPNCSFSHIKFAARNRTVYNGYRWNLIDKNDPDPHSARDIGETVPTNVRQNGQIVMIQKGKIIKVFKTQKEAAEHINVNASGISIAIKYKKELGGYSWDMWNNIEKEVQDTYLQSG